MWAIIKFEKKKLPILKKELCIKLGSAPEFYLPTTKIQKISKNKLNNKDFYLLGDYLLCFHDSFANKNIREMLRYCRGVKYFLNDFIKSQIEIIEFVKKCKLNEDEQGYIKQSFFNFKGKKKFKFLSGPFTNKIFSIINENQFTIKASIGNLNTMVSKKDYLYSPVWS